MGGRNNPPMERWKTEVDHGVISARGTTKTQNQEEGPKDEISCSENYYSATEKVIGKVETSNMVQDDIFSDDNKKFSGTKNKLVGWEGKAIKNSESASQHKHNNYLDSNKKDRETMNTNGVDQGGVVIKQENIDKANEQYYSSTTMDGIEGNRGSTQEMRREQEVIDVDMEESTRESASQKGGVNTENDQVMASDSMESINWEEAYNATMANVNEITSGVGANEILWSANSEDEADLESRDEEMQDGNSNLMSNEESRTERELRNNGSTSSSLQQRVSNNLVSKGEEEAKVAGKRPSEQGTSTFKKSKGIDDEERTSKLLEELKEREMETQNSKCPQSQGNGKDNTEAKRRELDYNKEGEKFHKKVEGSREGYAASSSSKEIKSKGGSEIGENYNVRDDSKENNSIVRGDRPLESIKYPKEKVNTMDNYVQGVASATGEYEEGNGNNKNKNKNKNKEEQTSDVKGTNKWNDRKEGIPNKIKDGIPNDGVMKSYGPKEQANESAIKYYDEGVTKDVIFRVGILFDKTDNGCNVWSSHFWQYVKLFNLVIRFEAIFVPVNDNIDNKEPLRVIPESCKSIKDPPIIDYAVMNSEWVDDQFRGQVRFASRVRMPQKWNAWRYGKNIQEAWQRETKKKGNTFSFMKVAEYDQIRIASVIGLGPATHLGDLKMAFVNEIKKREKITDYVPMELKNDELGCNHMGSRLEAPVVSVTVNRKSAIKVINLIKDLMEESTRKMLNDEDFSIFDRNISIFIDYAQEDTSSIRPLLETQIKVYKRSKVVHFNGIRDLDAKVTMKNGEVVTVRRAITRIPSDKTADGVPLFYQVDRKGIPAKERNEFQRRTKEIVLTCDEQLYGIAKEKGSRLQESLETILEEESFKRIFPPPVQRALIKDLFKEKALEVANTNVTNNIKCMEMIMSKRVSSALIIPDKTLPSKRPHRQYQSVYEMRRLVKKSMYEETTQELPTREEGGSNERGSTNLKWGSNEGKLPQRGEDNESTAIVAKSKDQNDGWTVVGASRKKKDAGGTMVKSTHGENTVATQKGSTFEAFLVKLEQSARMNEKAIEETKRTQEEEKKSRIEWQQQQESNNERMGKLIEKGYKNSESMAERLNESVKHNREMNEKVDILASELTKVTQYLMQERANLVSQNYAMNQHQAPIVSPDRNSREDNQRENNKEINAVPPKAAGGTENQ